MISILGARWARRPSRLEARSRAASSRVLALLVAVVAPMVWSSREHIGFDRAASMGLAHRTDERVDPSMNEMMFLLVTISCALLEALFESPCGGPPGHERAGGRRVELRFEGVVVVM